MRAGIRTGICQPPWPIADDRVGLDRRERAVAVAPSRIGLPRGAAAAAVELLRVAVVDEPHRPAGDPRKLGCGQRLEAGDVLGAEAAADELRRTRTSSSRSPNAAASSSRHEKIPCVETQAVSWSPSHEATARVRLERRLDLGRRLELELDGHVGGGEGRLGVAAGIVGRVVGEALLVDGLLRVDDVAEAPRCRVPERADASSRRLERVGRDDRDRLRRRTRARPRGAARASSASSSLSGPITARTPGTASAASRSSERTRPWATGERSTAAWSIPGSRTSTV